MLKFKSLNIQSVQRVKNPLSKSVTASLIAIIIVLTLLFSPRKPLTWDAFGYYLYLPLEFIYHDIRLENLDVVQELYEKYKPSSTMYQVFKSPDGGWLIKHTMGHAVMLSPFFFIGHLIALHSDFPADGYSMPYQIAVRAGGMLYVILALVLFRKVLTRFFSDGAAAMVMAIVVLGTNYLNYASLSGENIGEQVFAFTFHVLILWFTLRWHNSFRIGDLILLGVFCGLNILSRPAEAICLLIPLFWGVYSRETFVRKMRLLSEKWGQLLLFSLIVAGISSLQLAYWKMATGHFLFDNYSSNPGEGLDFLNPRFLKVLFSFRKGWLIYTPVMAFSLIGFVSMYRKGRFVFYPVLLYFILNLYLVSCWTNWWFNYSFSSRPLVSSYVVLSLPLGFFLADLNAARRSVMRTVYGIIFLLIGLNLFQTWQYHAGILSGSRMTRAYYFRIFGKTRVDEEDRKLLLVDRSQWPVERIPDENDYQKRRIYYNPFTDTVPDIPDTIVHFRLVPEHPYTPAYRAAYRDLTGRDHFYARATAEVFIPEDYREGSILMVMSFEHKGGLYKYSTLGPDPDSIRLSEWNRIRMDYLSPQVRSPKDRLGVYLWYRGQDTMLVRNMEIQLFEPLIDR